MPALAFAPYLLVLAAPLLLAGREIAPGRQVAVTIDDLPAMNADDLSAGEIMAENRKLLAALSTDHVPAIGFVIEADLYKAGEVDRRIAVLDAWLAAGLDLGNHTFSHASLNHTELRDWEDDVVQGESVTRLLLKRHPGHTLRYLRHPYLDVGPDLQTRRSAEAFLTARGYRVAPVTLDPLDWYFADLYRSASGKPGSAEQKEDTPLQRRLVQAWLTYADQVFTYEEQQSRRILGYEPRQILLLHDTSLEADHLPDLLAVLHRHAYTTISLDQALEDPAYAQPDTYISDTGASWIDHWAATRGQIAPPDTKPAIPKWVEDLHRNFERAHPD